MRKPFFAYSGDLRRLLRGEEVEVGETGYRGSGSSYLGCLFPTRLHCAKSELLWWLPLPYSTGWGGGPQPPPSPSPHILRHFLSVLFRVVPTWIPGIFPQTLAQAPASLLLFRITGVQRMQEVGGKRWRQNHLPSPVTTGTAQGNLQLLIGSRPGFLPASSLQCVPPSPPSVLQPLSESCTHCLKDPA